MYITRVVYVVRVDALFIGMDTHTIRVHVPLCLGYYMAYLSLSL